MKRILIIVFLLVLNFTLKAQIPQEPNTYGYNFKRVGADTLLWIPKDTLQVPSWGVGKTHIARKGTTLYYWDGTKWSAITGSGSTYTAGNGLTLSGSQFKLGGTLTEPTTITGSGTNLLKLDGYTSANVGYLGIGTDFGYIRFGDGGAFSPTYENEIYGGVSQIGLKTTGDIYLDAGDIYTIGIPTVSSTTGRKVALIDTATGKVERIDPASLVSTPTLQQVLTAGSTLTTNNTIIGDGFNFTMQDFNDIIITGDNSISMIGSVSGADGEFLLDLGNAIISSYSTSDNTYRSDIYIKKDSILITPKGGVLNIDSLRTWSGISDTTYKKPMTWDTRNGRWEYAANWYGGGGSGSVSSASGTGVSLVNGSSLIKRLKEGTGITITDNTDSVTISRVSDSTMVRNLRWKYRKTWELQEEWLGDGPPAQWRTVASGAGSVALNTGVQIAWVDSTYQGAVYAETGTTTTGYSLGIYGNSNSSNTGSFRGSNTKKAVYETRIRFDALSNGTNSYTALFGYIDWWASSFYQVGVKFVYDNATYGDYWVLRADDGGTSAVVTTTAVAANTDYVLRIEIDNFMMGSTGGSVTAYINDVEVVASSGTYPIVSNINKTNTLYPCLWIQKTAGTTSRRMISDWVYQYAEFITR